MLVEPKVFIEKSKEIGCCRDEFLLCANNLTTKPEIIEYFASIGTKMYYKIDYANRRLTVVSADNFRVQNTIEFYSDFYDTLKYFSH